MNNKKTINDLPITTVTQFSVDDFVLFWDNATGTTSKCPVSLFTALDSQSSSAPSDPDTKYWMSSVANGGELLASGGGYYLYSGPSAANVADVELTVNEAAAAANSRVFQTLTGSETVAQLGEMFAPIVAADTKVLDEVQAAARGYFHSLNLTLPEIQDKMVLYADALQAAAAGSVEATLAVLQSLTIPSAATSGTFDFNPTFQYTIGTTATAYQNYYPGDAPRDAYGIDEINFSNSFITLHFEDSAAMTAWRSQTQTFEIVNADGDNSWEKQLTMDSAAEYTSSFYNYVSYDFSSQLTYQEKTDLVLFAADTSRDVPFQISINAPTESVAEALGETDVIAQLITTLSEHLAKFPR